MLSDYDAEHIQEILQGHGDWFTAHLLRLCHKADPFNLQKIKTGFPDVVEAYMGWMSK